MIKTQSTIARIVGMTLLTVFSIGTLAACLPSQNEADTVFTNGNVYTVDDNQPNASAFAVLDGRFVAVGDENSIEGWIGENTEVVDLQGQFVMPGLHDAHIHLQMVAEFENGLKVDPSLPWNQIVTAIQEADSRTPEGAWLFGGNLPWLTDIIGEDTGLRAHYLTLDAIVADRPAAFWDVGGHAILANSEALRLAGIDASTPDPIGGTIERDEEGNPTGVLRELAANLITEAMPPMSQQKYIDGFAGSLSHLNSFGITSVNEVWAYPPTLAALKKMDEDGLLTMRVTTATAHPVEFVTEQARTEAVEAIGNLTEFNGNRLQNRYVKFVLDGSAGGQTLAMSEPFEGTDFRGTLRNSEDEVMAEVSRLHALGIGSVLHAVGDRAVTISLNAVENAIAEHGDNGTRHVIAHTVLVNPKDMDRFHELGVIAEFSPYFWMPSEGLEVVRQDIGDERLNWGWPVRQLLDRDVPASVGSDWPVVMDPNPFPALEALITRKKPGDREGAAYGANHAATIREAIWMYTMGGAFELYQEELTGSIEQGKYADFIVLDQDITAIDVYDIHKTMVLKTYLEGMLVFERSGAR